MAAVVCLGEALQDRLGPPGGDPAAAGAGCEDRFGGAPANVACGLAHLGTPSAFVGRLGRDPIGAGLAALFTARGVDQRGLQWDPQRPSRIVLVHRDAAGERQFGGFAGDRGQGFADQALDAGELSAALGPLLAQARWLLLGTIPLATPAAAQAAWLAVHQAAAAGVAVAIDVNWRPTFWDPHADAAAGPTAAQRQQILPLLAQAQLLKCAAQEARWLFGSTDPTAISRTLPAAPLVVVTDGAGPLHWGWAQGQPGVLYPFAVTAVDSTGAGDAFCAGLLQQLCANPQVLRPAQPSLLDGAMRSASACGALVCQAAGAIEPQPTAAQVAAFLRAHNAVSGQLSA
jgi:fructokinase